VPATPYPHLATLPSEPQPEPVQFLSFSSILSRLGFKMLEYAAINVPALAIFERRAVRGKEERGTAGPVSELIEHHKREGPLHMIGTTTLVVTSNLMYGVIASVSFGATPNPSPQPTSVLHKRADTARGTSILPNASEQVRTGDRLAERFPSRTAVLAQSRQCRDLPSLSCLLPGVSSPVSPLPVLHINRAPSPLLSRSGTMLGAVSLDLSLPVINWSWRLCLAFTHIMSDMHLTGPTRLS